MVRMTDFLRGLSARPTGLHMELTKAAQATSGCGRLFDDTQIGEHALRREIHELITAVGEVEIPHVRIQRGHR